MGWAGLGWAGLGWVGRGAETAIRRRKEKTEKEAEEEEERSKKKEALERIFVALAAVNNPIANLDLACIMSKL